VDGVRINYTQGDFFCLPAHCWHEHWNDTNEDAVLFATTDMPVLQALHFYREDSYSENGGHQKIIGTYEDRIAASS
jgi:gentisate 1,2-dioxygenase